MKTQLETITVNSHQCFSMMYNPRLSDLFFWHFHPEYELVYIEGATGTRHVGEHISTYQDCDLVLIGSNIPHLNFDYGVKTDYKKVVVHLKKKFVETHIQNTAELQSIYPLFEKAKYGIAFKGEMRQQIGQALFDFQLLSKFEQYIRLLNILKKLAEVNSIEYLHPTPYSKKYSEREQGRLRMIYGFIDKHYTQKIELHTIAAKSNMTKEAFCRYFKKATGNTFIEFLNRYRISQSKRILMSGHSVSEACFSSGFESLAYYNRVFKKYNQENPKDFRKRYL